MSAAELLELRRAAAELEMSVSDLIRHGSMNYYRQRQVMRRANANRQRQEPDPQD